MSQTAVKLRERKDLFMGEENCSPNEVELGCRYKGFSYREEKFGGKHVDIGGHGNALIMYMSTELR
jgi:hypothetical protein